MRPHQGFAAKPNPPGLPSHDLLGAALVNVKHQRFEQERLKAEGRFQFTCADPELSMGEKLAILTEEVGEVAQQVLEQPDRRLAFDSSGSRAELREELEQVAAVAVAWVESLLAEAATLDSSGEEGG
jgi:NTP pyrophosphatase (non-canonical NTP hydrolase)